MISSKRLHYLMYSQETEQKTDREQRNTYEGSSDRSHSDSGREYGLNMNESSSREEQSTDEIEDYIGEFKQRFKEDMRKPKFALSFIGVVVLAVYTIFTGLMYCENKKAADAAQSAATTAANALSDTRLSYLDDHRAWIGIALGQIEQFAPNNLAIPFKVTIQLHNSGKTPALDLQAGARFGFANRVVDGMPESFFNAVEAELRTTKGRMAVAPDFNTEASIDDGKDSEVRSKYRSILSGTQYVYVYGVVLYWDTGKREHRTRYCLYIPDLKSKKLVSCQKGNEIN
jgi:hypothetical protein